MGKKKTHSYGLVKERIELVTAVLQMLKEGCLFLTAFCGAITACIVLINMACNYPTRSPGSNVRTKMADPI